RPPLERGTDAVRCTTDPRAGVHVAGPLDLDLADHVLPRDATAPLVVELDAVAGEVHVLATPPAGCPLLPGAPANPRLEALALDLEDDTRRAAERLRVVDEPGPALEGTERVGNKCSVGDVGPPGGTDGEQHDDGERPG